ncbi:glycosyltransferase family 4 protein [uncultured Roseobacter sp.]|uniref:glycosyltransferase family 4 protein n=1 Tax=uncultured Roseobacter sp. TaxID=114847 RepID=UPI002632C25B|nr:glycosyltransferase family 4 protein [uncultured Roseobacter sp.]
MTAMPTIVDDAFVQPADDRKLHKRRAIVIGSLGYSLVNFRLDLMRRFQENGYEVLALAAEIDPATAQILDRHGIRHREIPMQRTGTNPFQDLKTLRALVSELRSEKPDIVLTYTMKPIIYGSLAARIVGVGACFAMFTGLGYAFMEDAPRGRRRLVRDISIRLHRPALKRIKAAFCYNAADRRDIRRFRMIGDATPLYDVPGSGVDTVRFAPKPIPQDKMRFLFVGRLLRSKGLEVLAAAAALLRAEDLEFDVQVLGPRDSNPDAISDAQLADWQARGLLTYAGETDDVVPFLQSCGVFVLPTQLREGIPRSILEAMSCGRAVITTDAPGCGENVAHDECGLVVPRGDAASLATAMRRFIQTPELAVSMGKAARARVCLHNDVHAVNGRLMRLMGIEDPLHAEFKPDIVEHKFRGEVECVST